jgi:branched-chain amino acid transport system permease protein
MVIMTLLGGMGTVLGPAIGATFLYLVSEMLWARFLYVYMALVGLIIIAVILFMPRGIVGSLRGRFSAPRRGL